MGIVIVEVCDYNILSAAELEEVFQRNDVAVMSYDCMNFCGMCAMGPYAMVNGRRIFWKKRLKNASEKIKAAVEEELEKLNDFYS